MGSDGVDEDFEVEKIAPSPGSNRMEPLTLAGDDNEGALGSVLGQTPLHGVSLVPSTQVLPKLPPLPKVNTKHAELVKAQARLTSALMKHCGDDTAVITKACMAHISSSRYPDPQALLVTLLPFTPSSAAVDIVSSIWHFLYSSSRDSPSRRESPGGRRRHRRRSLSDGEEVAVSGDRHRSQRKRHRRHRDDVDYSDSDDVYDDESAYRRRRKRQRRRRHRGSYQSRSRSRSLSSSRSESSLRQPTEEHDRSRRRETRRSRHRDGDHERDRHYERRRHRDRHRDRDRDKDYGRGADRDRGSGRHRERERERAHDRDPERTLDKDRDLAPEKDSRQDGHTARKKGHENELPTETFSNRNSDLDRVKVRPDRAGRVRGENAEVLDKQGDVQKPHRNLELEEELRRADERSERYLRRHPNSVRQSGSHRAERVGDVAYSASDGEQPRRPRNRVHDYDYGYDRDHDHGRDYDRSRDRGRDHDRTRNRDIRDKERTRDYNHNRARDHDRDRDQVRNAEEDDHIQDRRERSNLEFDSEPELGTNRSRRNPRDNGSKQGYPERGFEHSWKDRGRHSEFRHERRRGSKLTPEREVDERRDFDLVNSGMGRDNRDSEDVAHEGTLDRRDGMSKEDRLRPRGGPSRRNYREPAVGPSSTDALDVNGLDGRNKRERQLHQYDGERSPAMENRHRQLKPDWDGSPIRKQENVSGENEKNGQHRSDNTPAWLSRNNARDGVQDGKLEPLQQVKSKARSSTHGADHQDVGMRSKVKEETPVNVSPAVADVKVEEDRVAEARWKRFSKDARIVPGAGATTAKPHESGPSPRSGTKPSGSSSKLELLRSKVLKSMKKAPGNEGGGNDNAGPSGAAKQLQ